jgi:hypothetical protein
VVFSVTATGTPPFTYQWWQNGSSLDGGTNAVLRLPDVEDDALGSYIVVMDNAYGEALSAAATLSWDNPPVPGSHAFLRFASGGVRLSAADVLAADSDPDGDPLAIIGVGPGSAAGGAVSLQGNYIYYVPPAGAPGSDSFGYILSDGHCGGTAQGSINVGIKPDDFHPLNLGLQAQKGGSVQLSFDGVPGQTYRVQYCDSFNLANWQDLASGVADTFGVCRFADSPAATARGRFYRAVGP